MTASGIVIISLICIIILLIICDYYDMLKSMNDMDEASKDIEKLIEDTKEGDIIIEKQKQELDKREKTLKEALNKIKTLEDKNFKNSYVEHRIIQAMPNYITLKGTIVDDRDLYPLNRKELLIKDEVIKEIIAKDLTKQLIDNDLIQIHVEADPVQLRDKLYYKIIVIKE